MSQPKVVVKIEEVLEAVLIEAKNLSYAVGMSGGSRDGGAGVMEKEVAMFKMGMNYQSTGIIPTIWEKYVQQINKEKDPEYARFLELKKKFGSQ